MENEIKEKSEKEKPLHVVIRNTADYQRMKLDKLMKNPEKPVLIPERPKERGSPHVPDFVRNVMGSSAGAGSGEFHVYRHLRRKEYARQKFMQEKGLKEKEDEDYRQRLEDNKRKAEEKTAKKRAKRLKKNKKEKKRVKKHIINKDSSSEKSEESSEESESHEHELSSGSQNESLETENNKIEEPSASIVIDKKPDITVSIEVNKEKSVVGELAHNEDNQNETTTDDKGDNTNSES